jgi:hypothetical protein
LPEEKRIGGSRAKAVTQAEGPAWQPLGEACRAKLGSPVTSLAGFVGAAHKEEAQTNK